LSKAVGCASNLGLARSAFRANQKVAHSFEGKEAVVPDFQGVRAAALTLIDDYWE
jgi:hypothetical protein